MPAINPRRECSCHTSPVAAGRFQEERVGGRPFVALVVAAVVLVPLHLYLRTWGWVGWLVLVALDLIWIVVLLFYIAERRSQSRFGLGHVRLDALSYNLGQPLVLHVGSERGLGGLQAIEVLVRCVDAVYEMRDTGRGEERERICYAVWQSEQRQDAKDIPATGEARFQLDLPAAGTFADPVGNHIERYWEVEVTRYGGASDLRFRVLVYAPTPPDR